MRPLLILLIGAAAPCAAWAQTPVDAPPPAPSLAPLPTVADTQPTAELKTAAPPPAPVVGVTQPVATAQPTVVPPTLAPAKQGVDVAPMVVGVAAGAAGGAVAGPVGKFVGGFVGKRLLGPLFGRKDDAPRLQVVDAASADQAGKPAADKAAATSPKKEKVAER